MRVRHRIILLLLGVLVPSCGGGGGGGGNPMPGPPADGALAPLPYTVIAAAYSRSLDRLILVSANPPVLHSYNPATGAESQLALPRAPISVEIAPDGIHAAVGCDALVTLVNLATLTVTVSRPISTPVLSVVPAPNGYTYGFPTRDQWEHIRCVDPTGVETFHTGSAIYAGTRGKLVPGTTFMMGVQNGLSPAKLEKYDISGGTASYAASTSSNPVSGDLWVSSDGGRVFTGAGTIFAPSLAYLGTLAGLTRVQSLDVALGAGLVLAVPAVNPATPVNESAEVQVFDGTTYGLNRRFALPSFRSGTQTTAGLGRFLFVRPGDQHFVVVVQAAARLGLASPWAVVHYPMTWTGAALGAPAGLRGYSNFTSVSLTWEPVAGATSMSIYRASAPGVTAANYSGLPNGAKTVAGGTSATISGLTSGTTYYFVVTATNAFGESLESQELVLTPDSSLSQPGGVALSATVAGDRQVTLTWSSGSGATSYAVYASTVYGFTPRQYELRRTAFASPYTYTGLTNNVDYFFIVASVNAAGEGTPSIFSPGTPHPPGPAMTPLPHKVTTAEYSNALDRVVLVSTAPNALYVLNPVTGTETSVALPATPTCLSVSPSGLQAAVGYATSVSIIDLTGPSVTNTWPVSASIGGIALAGNGFVYTSPAGGGVGALHCVATSSGTETLGAVNQIFGETQLRLQPGALALYAGQQGFSPPNLQKFDVSAGTGSFSYNSPYFGTFSMGGKVYFTQDGSRVTCEWATTFSTSSTQATDLQYRGTLPGLNHVEGISHSTAAQRWAAIPSVNGLPTPGTVDTELRFFEDVGNTPIGRVIFAPFVVASVSYPAHGRFVFWNAAGTTATVLVQADSAASLTNDFAILQVQP